MTKKASTSPPGLQPDQRFVFDRLSARLLLPQIDRAYNALAGSRGGTIISVDVARFLAPEFHSWDGRVRHTPSTAVPAGTYAHRRVLAELTRATASKRLLITAGGAGSGKTTLFAQPNGTSTSLRQKGELIFDNQFANYDRASAILNAALANGWEVHVAYVHRPFNDVVRAVIERSQRTGRWNKLRDLPGLHLNAQSTFTRLQSEFASRVVFTAQFNRSAQVTDGSPGEAVPLTDLQPEGRYHLGNGNSLQDQISQIVKEAIGQGLVCQELAAIIHPEAVEAG